MLCEQLTYNLLFRWFVGLSMDDWVWVPTVFTMNRDRLLQGEIADAFYAAISPWTGRCWRRAQGAGPVVQAGVLGERADGQPP